MSPRRECSVSPQGPKVIFCDYLFSRLSYPASAILLVTGLGLSDYTAKMKQTLALQQSIFSFASYSLCFEGRRKRVHARVWCPLFGLLS